VPTLDHVNVCVRDPTAEREWLVGMLGYRPATPGPEASQLGTLHWFDADDGTQVHLTVDPNHEASASAHTAIRIGDRLDAVVARLEQAGHHCNTIAFDGDRHVFTTDPAGNLWELIGPLADA
jgi:catechol 2,3-dioxygenase-like lactoylglutathione lyase family enzyme